MSRAILTVTQAGPHVTVQDAGRPGFMRFGVSASGPMDRGSHAIANAALRNPCGQTALEISMGGLTLECVEGSVSIAIAGGGFDVLVDQTSLGSWVVTTLRAGSRLTIRPGHWGSWTYLCFAGDLQANSWLGSTSTHGPTGLGGGKITTGQTLIIENAEVRDAYTGAIPCPVTARPRRIVNVIPGPQDRYFLPETLEAFFSQQFTLTSAYDRMGVRLSGPALHPAAVLDMPSEAIVRGSVQVSGDGVATVLLADHQPTGGYPKIATIVADHLDGFVQLRSRDAVTFRRTTPEAAILAARTRHLADARFMAGFLAD